MENQDFYSFEANKINTGPFSFSSLKGKVVLVVNTASKCGFTNQYKDLEEIYKQYKDKGFVVLAFPCNQFGAQEPGDEKEILKFCSINYDITFPVFEKINVNGNDAHPLFKFLKEKAPGMFGTQGIKWNFTKFLISKDASSIERFAPKYDPKKIISHIENLL